MFVIKDIVMNLLNEPGFLGRNQNLVNENFIVKMHLYLLNKLNKVNLYIRSYFFFSSLLWLEIHITQPKILCFQNYFTSSKSQDTSISDLTFKGINPRNEFNWTASYLRFLEWLPCEVAQIKPNLVMKQGYADRNSEQWFFRLQYVLDFPYTQR